MNNFFQQILQSKNEMYDYWFEKTWDNLKRTYADKVKKVKKNFVKKLTYKTADSLLDVYSHQGMPLPEMLVEKIVNHIFHYHYLMISDLSDKDRADKQKDKEYIANIMGYAVQTIAFTSSALMTNSPATPYTPEIFICNATCDSFLTILQQLAEEVSSTNESLPPRYETILKLLMRVLSLMKSVLLQLTQSFTDCAIVMWRTCFEIEYTILALTRYDDVLTDWYRSFSRYGRIKKDSDEQERKEYEEFAKSLDQKPYRMEFRNYGWLLCIKDHGEIKPNIKTLLKVSKYSGLDHEKRYSAYQFASKFTHSNAISIEFEWDNKELYTFIISQIFMSLQNIEYALLRFIKDYRLEINENAKKVIEQLTQRRGEIYEAWRKTNVRINDQVAK